MVLLKIAWLNHVAVSGIDLTEVQCDPELVEGYVVPDPVYCDRLGLLQIVRFQSVIYWSGILTVTQ